MKEKIDAVITWVDGDDPRHIAKRKKYAPSGAHIEQRKDISAATRYKSLGEIYWCVRSIMKFAPFIHKIYIVTDHQDPEIEKHIPDLSIPVEIVDHTVIFRGYEEYLPTFSSMAIETMIWRIPGLSEDFVYLNDDFFIVSSVEEEDWFDEDGHPKIYGKPYNTLRAKLARQLNYIMKGKKVVKFRDTMLNAALLPEVNLGRFIRLQHLPLSMKKSLYEDYYSRHPEAILQNIRHRFRDVSQYNPQELNYLLACRCYGIDPIDAKPLLVTMGPSGEHRFHRRFKRLKTTKTVKYLCVNSLDMMTENLQHAIRLYLEDITDIAQS